jgi:hypothetical protein
MLRALLAVVVGYLGMAVLVFAGFSLAYLVLGADRAFRPGTYEVTPLWVVTAILLGFASALVGGLICAAISTGGKAPVVLAAIVLVLGLGMAVAALLSPIESPPPARTGHVSNYDAMQHSQRPGWVALLDPIVGAAGILIGSRLRREPTRAG